MSSVAVNPSGEWLAFGCATIGQLLVWEWQSETYILKQQGHYYDMNVIAYSPDGNYIATGGDDAKVTKQMLPFLSFFLISFSLFPFFVTSFNYLQVDFSSTYKIEFFLIFVDFLFSCYSSFFLFHFLCFSFHFNSLSACSPSIIFLLSFFFCHILIL